MRLDTWSSDQEDVEIGELRVRRIRSLFPKDASPDEQLNIVRRAAQFHDQVRHTGDPAAEVVIVRFLPFGMYSFEQGAVTEREVVSAVQNGYTSLDQLLAYRKQEIANRPPPRTGSLLREMNNKDDMDRLLGKRTF